jgi:hypothetical protein
MSGAWIDAPAVVRRLLVVLGAGAAAYTVTALLQLEPDLSVVLLLTGLALVGATLVTRSVSPIALEWLPPTPADPLTRGRDGATFADLRLLESHRSARHPDDHLRRRLADLADRALRTAHGVALASDEGRDRLGPDVVRLLGSADRPRRLSTREIDLCLRTIEEL